MAQAIYVGHRGALEPVDVSNRLHIAELVAQHPDRLEQFTAAGGEFVFWFGHHLPSPVNRIATELLLATTAFSARDAASARGRGNHRIR